MKACAVDGCKRPARARGWCVRHYQRWWNHGDPTMTVIAGNGDGEAWLREAVLNGDRSQCWPWPFGCSSKGYGEMTFAGHHEATAHVALALDGRWRPPGLFALHRCDNPPCVNPDHLYWGTRVENAQDAVARGQQPRGEQHGSARLAAADVLAIRIIYAAGGITQEKLAARFGVSPGHVSQIVRGERWSHLP